MILVMVLEAGCSGMGQQAAITTATQVAASSEEPTPTPLVQSRGDANVVLMDGELVAIYPSLKLAFGGNVNAEVKTLDIEIGQRVKQGDLIATLDDTDLKRAVDDAQLALDRAKEDRERIQADREEKYNREVQDANENYDRQIKDADKKYDREKRDAENALETARYNLQRAQMQPPTTSLQEAKNNLKRAQDSENTAADNYKQALDRPWEPQRNRDNLYKEWQQSIVDRQLAELRIKDAEIALTVHYLDLDEKKKEVQRAEVTLTDVEKDTVEKDDVDLDDDYTTYDRAITDAEKKLGDAQEDLTRVNLYAPWDGLVLTIDTTVGATVSSGTPVVTLLNVTDLYFVTQNLSERHVAQVRAGQEAHITLRTYPDIVLTGLVETIVPETERQADSDARFKAYVRLEASELNLLPGMTGRVEIVTGSE